MTHKKLVVITGIKMSKNKSAKFIKKQQNKNKRGQALKGYQHLSEEERNEN